MTKVVAWGLDWGTTDMGGQQIWHHLLITLRLFQHKKNIKLKTTVDFSPRLLTDDAWTLVYMLYKVLYVPTVSDAALLHDGADTQFVSTVILSCKWTVYLSLASIKKIIG